MCIDKQENMSKKGRPKRKQIKNENEYKCERKKIFRRTITSGQGVKSGRRRWPCAHLLRIHMHTIYVYVYMNIYLVAMANGQTHAECILFALWWLLVV